MIRLVITLLMLCLAPAVQAQQRFQLSQPLLDYSTAFIRDSVQLRIQFNQPGAAVHYCFDDREPEADDPVYNGPISIKKAGMLSIRALGENFLPSETIRIAFHPAGRRIDSLQTSPMNEYYSRRPARLLNDARGGIANYRSEGWLGFDSDTVWIEARWEKKQSVREIGISLLRDQPSWIFLPQAIEIWIEDEKAGKWKLLQSDKLSSEAQAPKKLALYRFKWAESVRTKALRIRMLNVTQLPDWHSGRGQRGWIFVDELIVQ